MFLLILISKLAATLWGKTFATLSAPIKSHRGSRVLKYKGNKAGNYGFKTFQTFTGKAGPVKDTNEEERGGNKRKSVDHVSTPQTRKHIFAFQKHRRVGP